MKRREASEVNKRTQNLTNEISALNNLIQEINELYEQEDYEKALNKCIEGESKAPNNKITFWYMKALCLENLKKNDEALGIVHQILQLDPNHKGAKAWIAGDEFDKIFNPDITLVNPEMLTKLEQYASSLAENNILIGSIKKMCQKFDGNLNIVKSALNYQKIFKKEEEKKEKDLENKIDFGQLNGSLSEILSNEGLKDKLKDLKEEAKDLKSNNAQDFTKFSKLFHFLSRLNDINKKFIPKIQKICSIISIKYEYLEFYFLMFDQINSDEDEDEKEKNTNIPELDIDFPPFVQYSFDKKSKPLGQILDELVLDMRNDSIAKTNLRQETIEKYIDLEEKDFFLALNLYKSDFGSNKEILDIVNGYENYRRFYQKWESKSANEIRNWAVQCKGNLSDVHEAIAVMDRGNSLITGGHRLRHTQVVSLLTYFQSYQDNIGKLLQISTGEGKTLIVSLFCVICALKGETVDVITSNTVLAEEGANERRQFYNLFGLSVTTNNPNRNDEKSYKGHPYKADILYGCISSFQFDYLKDSFEGLGSRGKRKFESVMIDEVDSMLIDNGGHIAKLSGPLPGMESLRFVYIKIWIEMTKRVIELYKNFEKEIDSKRNELLCSKANTKSELVSSFSEFYESLLKKMTETLKIMLKGTIKISDFKNIPTHLIDYANNKLEQWMDNAIYAKFYCHENKQYLIKKLNDEDVVVPIDYENTGVTLKNTIWSNGLHQFVQLKHNLFLTSESLTSSFISNIGFIKRYKRIYGLTGTLGSQAEQDLLSSAYNLKYSKIPTYKIKKFKELNLISVNEADFASTVAVYALEQCDSGRAVLIICETIEDLKKIKDELELAKKIVSVKFQIKSFPDEDSSKITKEKLNSGDIVISTNIAGRGTDFKTSDQVEQNGGLHVIVTFLPCNKRVEDQAFGRTSRQGKNGTAQIIMIADEILNKYGTAKDVLKKYRDKAEAARISQIQNFKLNEIDYNDKIFSLFSDLYVELYKKHKNDQVYPYFLNDLKEYWAFWLEKNKSKQSNVESDFENFRQSASDILNCKIKHNPYYSIKLANSYISIDKIDEAKRTLEEALSFGNSSSILYPAYIKLFEIAIQSGGQMKERFCKALSKVIFISYEKNETYKHDALQYLKKAMESLNNEIENLNQLLDEKNKDLSFIIVRNENNYFLKHLVSRLACLTTYKTNMESLIKQFDTEHGLAMSKKIPGYLLENKDKDILNSEVKEIEFIGLNEIYYLRTVYDVEPKIIERAQIQIGSGLAVLAIGLVFPPALVVCGPVAGALISEGVCDIVMELISQGDSEFNEKEYAKSKIISYGISVATMGISAVASCLKLLSKASKVCASISNAFRNSPFMKSIMKKVGDKIMDLSKKIDTLIKTRLADIEKISKLSKVDKIKLAFRNVAVETLTSVGTSVLDQQITEPALKEILKSLKPQIKQKVKEKLENCQEIIDKMKSYKKNEKEKELDKDISKALDSDITEDILDISKEISIGVLSSAKQKWVRNIALILDSVVSIHKMNTFADNFCIKLNQHLKTIDSNSQKKADSNSEDLSEVVDNLSDQVTERIFSLAINLGKQFTGRITNPLISNVVEHIVPSVKFNGNSNDSIIQKNDDDSSKVNQNTEFQNALKTLGLGPNPTLAEITRAYRLKSLLNHPDRGGSTEAMQRINNARVILMNNSTKPHSNSTANNSTENNSTRNNSNSSGNPIPKNSLIVMGNTEINNCGQYVISKIFNVDPHDLWRKTGVTNFGQGSHVSDHKLQFRILGFEPVEYNFKSLTRNDVQDFLKTNNSSQAMLFINKQNTESIGHVVLVKNTNNILTVHDTFYKMPLDEFLLKKNGSLTGTLLTGNNLDFQMTHVRNAINQNSMPHQSLFNLHSTGQESNRQRYGSVTGKKKNKKRKRISSTDANQNKKNRKRKIFTENNTHYPGFTLNGAIKEHVHGRVSDFLKVCEIVRLLKINGCDFVVEASAKFQAFQGIHPGKDDSSKDHRIIDSSNFDRMNNDLKNHDTSQTTKNIEQYIKQYQDHLSNLDKTQRTQERISPTFNKELIFEFNGISYRFNNIDFILNNFDKRFSSLNFPFQVGTHLDAAHTTGIHIQAQTKDKFFNFVQQNLLNRLISMTNLLPKCLNIGPDKIIDDAQQKFAEKLIDLIGKNKTLSIQDMKNLMHEYIDTCIDKLTIKKNEVNDNLVKLEVLAKYIDELKRIKNTIDDLIVSKIRLNCKEDISCLMEEFEKK